MEITDWTYCIKGVPGSFPPPKRKVLIICKRWAAAYKPAAIRIGPKRMVAFVGNTEIDLDIKEIIAWRRVE